MREERLHIWSSVLHTFEKITVTHVRNQQRNRTSLLPVFQACQIGLCIVVSMASLFPNNVNPTVTNSTMMTQDPGTERMMRWWSHRFMHKMFCSQIFKIHKGLEQKPLFIEIFPHSIFLKMKVVQGLLWLHKVLSPLLTIISASLCHYHKNSAHHSSALTWLLTTTSLPSNQNQYWPSEMFSYILWLFPA